MKRIELLEVDQILRPPSRTLHRSEIVETSDRDDYAFELNLRRREQVAEAGNTRHTMKDMYPSRGALETAIDRADECLRRERCRWVRLVDRVKFPQGGAEPLSVGPFGFNHDVEVLCCPNHAPGGNGEPSDYDETNAVALEGRRDRDRIEGLIGLHVGPDGTG